MPDSSPAPDLRAPSTGNVALRAFLGQGGALLLFGLLAGAGHNPNATGSAYGLLGLYLILIVCAAVGLCVALAYGAQKRSMLPALGGALLGTLVGGFAAGMLLLILPDMKVRSDYAKDMEGRAVASLEYYNHTAETVSKATVDGEGYALVDAYGINAGSSSSSYIPRQWHEGLSATVKWETSSPDPTIQPHADTVKQHEKIVPIERYREPGRLHVHFLPGNNVRLLVVGLLSPRHPDYPGPAAPDPPPDWPPWLNESDEPVPPAPPLGQGVAPPIVPSSPRSP